MDENEYDDRVAIMEAISEAIKAFNKHLGDKYDWQDCQPRLCIEARELRSGDLSLGESYIVDQIKEYLENPID